MKTLEVKKLLKEIDVKKAVGVDAVPPKLINIGSDIMIEPLTVIKFKICSNKLNLRYVEIINKMMKLKKEIALQAITYLKLTSNIFHTLLYYFCSYL